MGADNLVVRSDLQAAAAALSDNSRARRRSSGFSGKHADQWLPNGLIHTGTNILPETREVYCHRSINAWLNNNVCV